MLYVLLPGLLEIALGKSNSVNSNHSMKIDCIEMALFTFSRDLSSDSTLFLNWRSSTFDSFF